MAASAFLVTLPLLGGMTLDNDCDSVIVWAEDAAMAKSMAAAASGVDAVAWADATATALVINTELEGWTMTVTLKDPVTPFDQLTASFVALNAGTIDTIGTGIAAALTALAAIAGAAYDTATNVLTIVETTDSMGDWYITAKLTPPAALTGTATALALGGSAGVSGLIGAITAVGAAGIARTSTLVASLPAFYGMAKLKR